MQRLTSDRPASEMSALELAHNSCYIRDGKARYRDYSLDMDARELAMRLLKDLAGGGARTGGEDFEDWIADSLQDGMGSAKGLVAVFYRSLWAMAELREHLKAYEDTGLTPEQIVKIDLLYAEKCREVARLSREYGEMLKQGGDGDGDDREPARVGPGPGGGPYPGHRPS